LTSINHADCLCAPIDEEPGEEISQWTPAQCAALALAAVTGVTLEAGMLAGPWLGGPSSGPPA
jgi:hypothetical protein